MLKIDFKKEYKSLYHPSDKEAVLIEVPPMNYLMVDGAGNPNTAQEFQDAVEVLYGLSYALKFQLKKTGTANYTVMPLEGLWWTDRMSEFDMNDKEKWKWTLMIMQPGCVTEESFKSTLEQVKSKKHLPALARIRFGSLDEGMSAQIMHVGLYSTEGATIEKLHSFIKEKGCRPNGKHHEIYLSDPRRTDPEKMKTLIRQPVCAAAE